jgi:hypothetical protein
MNKTATKWLLLLLCSGIALAQSTSGSGAIGGTVTDNNGDGLPDTDVVIENQSLALQRAAGTSDDGVFQAPGLIAASGYKLKIARKGFQAWESSEFSVPVGQTVNFSIKLQPGEGNGNSTAAAVYTTENGKVGLASVFTAEQIEALPLMQRTVDSLPPLVANVTTDPGGDQVSFLGQPFPPAFLTDGILTRDAYFARPPQTDLTPLDAIQGTEVLVADPPAQFGHSMNGVANSATRSGTNSYRVAAYDYLRLPSLTAVGRFAEGQTLLHGRNQGGANVGGPILSSKLFFFANGEAISDRYDALNRITTQLIADPTGSTVASSNCKATVAACALADKFIQSQMNVLVPLSAHSIDGLARLDYRLGTRNSISLAANVSNALAPDWLQVSNAASNGGLLGLRNTRDDSRYVDAAVTTTLFSSTTNEFRLGESQQHISQLSSNSNLSTGDIGITLAGATIGDPNPTANLVEEHRYQVVDNYTAPWGSHTFQFGVDASTNEFHLNSLDSIPNFDYATLTAFATDLSSTTGKDYTLLTQSLGLPARHFPLGEIDIYGQDTWRASPKLTITIGLRWDKPSVPKPTATNTSYYQTGSIPSPRLDLAPRVGIAYKVNDKTVVRAGYGFFFEPFSGQLMDALYLGNAQSQANLAFAPGLTGAPAFPAGIPVSTTLASGSAVNALPVCNYGICTVSSGSSAGTIPAGAEEITFSNNKLPNPHTQQVTLAVERRISSNTTLTLNLIDSHAFRLITATDYNLAPPTQSIIYTVEDVSGNKTGTFTMPVYTALNNIDYSHVYQIGNGGSARYDAATLDLRRQLSRGLMFDASYTWSHAFDDLTGVMTPGGIPLVEQNTSAFTSNRASTPTDQRQRLVVNATWQPEIVKSKSFFARYLINGWQLSPILVLASGHPVTATVAADELEYSSVTPLYPGTLDGSGGTPRVPFLPIASYLTGAEHNLNVRLARAIPITERVHALIMFDIFNALNSQWVTGINSVAYTASAGIIRAVPGAGTGNAAVSYPYGTNARSAEIAFRVTF